MRDIYLIRHGKTAGNMEKRYVGRTDEPLCKAGICEINERRNILLRSFLPENERDGMSQIQAVYAGDRLPETVYVSQMLRCRQTAELLFPGVVQVVVPDFRETDFGQFEYKNYEELSEDKRYQAFIDSGGHLDFPDAEPHQQFRQRVRDAFVQCLEENGAFMASLTSDESREPLVFVVHGGTIMAIMEEYARPHRDYFDWQVAPVSGYRCRIERAGDGFCLKDAQML